MNIVRRCTEKNINMKKLKLYDLDREQFIEYSLSTYYEYCKSHNEENPLFEDYEGFIIYKEDGSTEFLSYSEFGNNYYIHDGLQYEFIDLYRTCSIKDVYVKLYSTKNYLYTIENLYIEKGNIYVTYKFNECYYSKRFNAFNLDYINIKTLKKDDVYINNKTKQLIRLHKIYPTTKKIYVVGNIIKSLNDFSINDENNYTTNVVSFIREFTKISNEENNRFTIHVVELYKTKNCIPCDIITFNLNKAINSHKDRFILLEIDNNEENKDIIKNNGITDFPSIFIYENGKIKYKVKGNISIESIENLLKFN